MPGSQDRVADAVEKLGKHSRGPANATPPIARPITTSISVANNHRPKWCQAARKSSAFLELLDAQVCLDIQ
jgi:hypothetical protein